MLPVLPPCFPWCLPCLSSYSLALYGHRYLENGVAPLVAKRVFLESAYSQIIVSGSNFGELLGAISVFFLNDAIPTPIPWLRLDALLLLIVWVTPWYTPTVPESGIDVKYAWILAAIFIPISFGWAAGDVSLAAYIQASLARVEGKDDKVSALGAVMAFLYSTYIVTYAILGSVLGRYIDHIWNTEKSAKTALINIGGVQFSVLAGIVLIATMIPTGALRLNPKLLFDEDLSGDVERSDDGMKKGEVEMEGSVDENSDQRHHLEKNESNRVDDRQATTIGLP